MPARRHARPLRGDSPGGRRAIGGGHVRTSAAREPRGRAPPGGAPRGSPRREPAPRHSAGSLPQESESGPVGHGGWSEEEARRLSAPSVARTRPCVRWLLVASGVRPFVASMPTTAKEKARPSPRVSGLRSNFRSARSRAIARCWFRILQNLGVGAKDSRGLAHSLHDRAEPLLVPTESRRERRGRTPPCHRLLGEEFLRVGDVRRRVPLRRSPRRASSPP